MIEVIFVKGIHAPVFVCDACGERIKKASEGIVKFGKPGARPISVHKADVSPGCDLRGDGYSFWHELDTFLVWLEQNAPFDRKHAEHKASWLERT